MLVLSSVETKELLNGVNNNHIIIVNPTREIKNS